MAKGSYLEKGCQCEKEELAAYIIEMYAAPAVRIAKRQYWRIDEETLRDAVLPAVYGSQLLGEAGTNTGVADQVLEKWQEKYSPTPFTLNRLTEVIQHPACYLAKCLIRVAVEEFRRHKGQSNINSADTLVI